MTSASRTARNLLIGATVLSVIAALVSGSATALHRVNAESAQSAVIVYIGFGAANNTAPAAFNPSPTVVVIGVNNTVTWVNEDTPPHTVTSESGNGSISSGPIASGASFNYTFTSAGTYNYVDPHYSWMKGTVVVLAPGETIASSSATRTAAATNSFYVVPAVVAIAVVIVAGYLAVRGRRKPASAPS